MFSVDVVGLSGEVNTMSAGYEYTCALLSSGGVKCWGVNLYGNLGNGSTISVSTPVDVSGLSSGVIAISAGRNHTCALLSSGGVKCWGDDMYGDLGDGKHQQENQPVDVSGLSSGVIAVSAGGNHTCALLSSGGVKCWGNNAWGQLGDGTRDNKFIPVDVSGLSTSGVVAISAGGSHTCALLSSGGVKCWGINEFGQLGKGESNGSEILKDNLFSTIPIDVVGLSSGVTAISAGGAHTCALMNSSGIKCWGDNFSGQLGNGTTSGPTICDETMPCSTFPVDVVNNEQGID
jgi:alpha-tubulin suppressor-like RCC1 family protein